MIAYTLMPDLAKAVEVPAESIVTHMIHQDDWTKAMLSGFGQAQEPIRAHAATLKSPGTRLRSCDDRRDPDLVHRCRGRAHTP
jgi:hypothetical protein